jgi:hypothetical protein
MAAVAQRIRLRLFIEGVEIPCISCQVSVQPNSPMTASIQIPPLSEATRFLPKSLIHVFFWDDYSRDADATFSTSEDSVLNGPESMMDKEVSRNMRSEDTQEADKLLQAQKGLNAYKLFFVGELMGFQWSKNPTNRSIVLQAADLSNYWDYASQSSNSDIFGPGIKAMFSGGATNLFTDFLEEPGGAVIRILMTPSVRYPELKGLLGGIVHLLEAMGGSYYYDKKFAGQNIFYSLAELRLHITQLITAYDKDPTAKRLMGGGYDALFGRSIGNLGDQASFRKVINMLAGMIFHETYGQPCPRYIPSNVVAKSKVVPTSTPTATDTFAREIEAVLAGLRAQVALLDAYEAVVGAVKSASKYLLKTVDNPKDKSKKQKVKEALQGLFSRTKSARSKSTEFTNIPGLLDKSAAAIANAINKTTTSDPRADLDFAISTLETVLNSLNGTRYNSSYKNVKYNESLPSRLNQQIMRPDVWFSAPPRCNVVFPEQYSSLSYSRQFMAEPTRLLLKTNDEFFGEDELFDKFYFAPKAITTKQEQSTLQALLRGDLMNHELYTGVLPVFEKMGEFNIFAAKSGIVDGKVPKLGLAQRSTNFLYFKYRFAARQLQVSGKFNPYIACGFPGLIIDKYVDIEVLKTQVELLNTLPKQDGMQTPNILQLLGTHFLANFTEVQHQVDQSQGVTMLNCSYARQPEESVEFLGNIQDEVEYLKRDPKKVTKKTTTVASIYAPRVNSQGPGFGRIISVVDVTNREQDADFEFCRLFPVFGGPRDKTNKKQLSVKAPVGFSRPAKDYGKEVVAIVGDPDLIVRFRAYDVTEEKTSSTVERVDLPPEEYIRPGWYGDCWHPSKISEVYYDFFSTGAITEPQQVQNFDGTSGNVSHTTSDAAESYGNMVNDNDPEKFTKDMKIALTLTKDSNIQQAVALLVLTYSVIKQGGFSADEFIRTYTWRPIATMLDMFGTSDLILDAEGKNVVSGVEGFHSRAFGPYENLFGLVTEDLSSIVGIKKGSSQSKKMDTRLLKFQAALAYAAQLRLSRAILG